MQLGHVVRCRQCRDEFALVPGYSESEHTCWECLHPEARSTSTAPAVLGSGSKGMDISASGEAPRPEPSIFTLCEA